VLEITNDKNYNTFLLDMTQHAAPMTNGARAFRTVSVPSKMTNYLRTDYRFALDARAAPTVSFPTPAFKIVGCDTTLRW
jgi:hypothetical protein